MRIVCALIIVTAFGGTPSTAQQRQLIFPSGISLKYANEDGGRARMYTCLDQYLANKPNNANGGLNWIQQGGGYYSACNQHLKLPQFSAPVPPSPKVPTAQNQRQFPPKPLPRGNAYPGRSAASVCEDGHWIEEVLADGKIIKLEDGSLWRVDDIDAITSSIWLPVSEIVVCAGKLINTDDNESVEARRIN
jgi:hypothetical protein